MISVVWKVLKFQLAVAFVILFLFLLVLLGKSAYQDPLVLADLMLALVLAIFIGWGLVRTHLVESQFVDFLSPSLASGIVARSLVDVILGGFYFGSLCVVGWLFPDHDIFRILGFTPLETSVVLASIFLVATSATIRTVQQERAFQGSIIIAGLIGLIFLVKLSMVLFWVGCFSLSFSLNFLTLNKVGSSLPVGFANRYVSVMAALSFAILGGGIWMTWRDRNINPYAAARFLPGNEYIDDLGSSNLEVAKVIYQIKVFGGNEAGPERDKLILQSIDSLLELCPYEPRFSPVEVHCSGETSSFEVPSLGSYGISQALISENPFQVILALKVLAKQKEISTDHLQLVRKIAESDSPYFAEAGVILEEFPNSSPGVVPTVKSPVTFHIVSK